MGVQLVNGQFLLVSTLEAKLKQPMVKLKQPAVACGLLLPGLPHLFHCLLDGSFPSLWGFGH